MKHVDQGIVSRCIKKGAKEMLMIGVDVAGCNVRECAAGVVVSKGIPLCVHIHGSPRVPRLFC